MEFRERMRPKGYNRKVWDRCWIEAESDKRWAESIIKDSCVFYSKASQISIQMLGEYLYLAVSQIAKSHYDYLHMRSHGIAGMSKLDPSAFDRWKLLAGRHPFKTQLWHYDHTKHITSARYVNGKWIDFNGKPCGYKSLFGE